jgi:hypothetical protein
VSVDRSPTAPPPAVPPAVPPAAHAFLRALRALRLPEWHAVLAAARARRPADPALLDALTALAITTARLGRHELRRAVEDLAHRALAPVVLTPAVGDATAPTGWRRGEFTIPDQATLQFAAEWAVAALLVRDDVGPIHFGALYAPFAAVIPLAALGAPA